MSTIRQAVVDILVERGGDPSIDPGEALFTSGRLDSVAAVQIMLVLERDFGIDLAEADFDISRLDTLNDLEQLVSA
ncbi:hypothetical protein FQ775_23750 [Nitratireductor mangrovi]|uniref:Carrier domain-containing protein n=1 Tax=Nitratireductor mangrovi TaxID=2599600 RepID=A0A6H0DY61_9HYPH|nr:phosphopantetheine-binding protein [Nitratireductor mangrovi]QIS94623.1 hypothetical protein FQ775_23750 [Nitratireductor mangrovi]